MKYGFCVVGVVISLLFNGLWGQNAPISTAETLVSVESTAVISITAINFNNISSCNLELHYDSTIARATAVTTGPLVGDNLSYNVSVHGTIVLGWYVYPALTLGGDPVLFNIEFTKVDTGKTAITWYDNGYSCIYYNGNDDPLNDSPTSTYYINGALTFLPPVAPVMTAPVVHGTKGVDISIPFYVSGFNDVGKFTLTLSYDPSLMLYQSFTGNEGFPGLTVDGSFPGIVLASGVVSEGVQGITLPDSSALFTLNFDPYYVGTTPITWSDTGTSCGFYGPPPAYITLSDIPKNQHYVNGSIIVASPFGISPPGGANGNGDEHFLALSCSPNPFSGDVKLSWFLPVGGEVLLEIRNLLGMNVSKLVDEVEQEGDHSMQVSSIYFQPGVYVATIVLTTSCEVMRRSVKMIFTK
jgi:hypothetical protein